ncbi:MAG: hypothetical protein AB8B65_19600 [Kordia sp.]|uniref:hypothetical protein n=1 Tax=Kordia sp. TaxID=1965332 RepID=UPI00385EDBA7
MKFAISIFLILFSTSILHSQELKKVERDGFSIEFPNHWEEKETPNHLIYIKEQEYKSSGFAVTIELQITKNNVTLSEFTKGFEADILKSKSFKNFEFKLKKEVMYGEKKAMRYFCKAEASHIPLEIFMIAMEHDEKIVLTKATAFWMDPSKKTQDFIQLMKKVEAILNSIKID